MAWCIMRKKYPDNQGDPTSEYLNQVDPPEFTEDWNNHLRYETKLQAEIVNNKLKDDHGIRAHLLPN